MIARTQRLLANIQELAPDITSRAAEIEAGRRMPPDLVEALRSIGIFRIFVPQSHGGLELDMPAALEVFGALSRIDGSVGWISMIGGTHGMFTPLLPRDTYERVYQDGPDVIIAGSAQPVGIAEAVAGGWRVSGRWPFASGCQHAEWMFGFCVMTEGGKPLPGPAGEGGPPLVRGVFLPARDWQSRTLGTSQGSRVLGAITSHSETRSSRREIFLISRTAYRACRDRFIKPCCHSSR